VHPSNPVLDFQHFHDIVAKWTGSFSFKGRKIHQFHLDETKFGDLIIRIEPFNRDYAVLRFVNGAQKPISIPTGVRVTTDRFEEIRSHDNQFFIIFWINTYFLTIGGKRILTISNQKQSSIDAQHIVHSSVTVAPVSHPK
jgi:hypothetical protein